MARPAYIFGQFRETARCHDAQHGDGVCCALAPQLLVATWNSTGKVCLGPSTVYAFCAHTCIPAYIATVCGDFIGAWGTITVVRTNY